MQEETHNQEVENDHGTIEANDDIYDIAETAPKKQDTKSDFLETAKESEELKGEKEEKEKNSEKESVKKEGKPKEKKSKSQDIDVESLQSSLDETKKWGQKKNKTMLANKRRITQLLDTFRQENIMSEDDVNNFMSTLDDDIDDLDTGSQSSASKGTDYNALKTKIDQEFEIFKKYNRDSKQADNYKAFYENFHLLDAKQQEDAIIYMEDESPDEALNYVLSQGAELNDALDGLSLENGGFLTHIKKLNEKIDKLKKKNKELSQEIDSTTKKVYNRTDSKATETNGNSYFENDYYS